MYDQEYKQMVVATVLLGLVGVVVLVLLPLVLAGLATGIAP